MKLIADSGSTKCDWALIHKDKSTYFTTKGLNPFFIEKKVIKSEFEQVKRFFCLENQTINVYFYGAGCTSEEKKSIIKKILSQCFLCHELSVEDDLKAGVLAFNETSSFICCILGTGSNTAYFDGQTITQKTPSLGYLLGDEASGSYFGKKILQAYFYKKLPQHLENEFGKTYNLTKDLVLERIYRKPNPNLYLASFFEFLAKHSEDKYIKNMVLEGFEEFLQTHVCPYPNYLNLKINLIGSIASIFRGQLFQKATEMKINIGKIYQKPIEGLVEYHKTT